MTDTTKAPAKVKVETKETKPAVEAAPEASQQEAAPRDFNAKEEILSLHRKLEYVANQMNIRLPA